MSSISEQLKLLAELRDEGTLSEEEFDRKRAMVLSRTPIVQTSVAQPPLPRESNEEALLGNVSATDVAYWDKQASLCGDKLRAEQDLAQSLRRSLLRTTWLSRYLHLLQSTREVCQLAFSGKPLAVLIGTMIIAACCIIGMALFTIDGSSLAIAFLVGLLLGLLVTGHLFVLPNDSVLNAQLRSADARVVDLRERHAASEAAVAVALRRYEDADLVRQRFRRVLESRRHRLLTQEWRLLRGVPFETFLVEIFEELGYVVETTKVTGDEGVDLVVSRLSRRIAIQAKGYANSVGREAVQEAYTGMRCKGCNVCLVITNSAFTAPALDTAQKVGCLMIDQSHIPDLIRGKIEI